MSVGLVLKATVGALILPGFFLLAWSLLLALPALLILGAVRPSVQGATRRGWRISEEGATPRGGAPTRAWWDAGCPARNMSANFGSGTLGLLRWVAFGWAGSFDLEMTAETCPVGTATIARLGPRLGPRGLRHGYSYNDRRAPVHIARFIRRGLGETGRPATVPARAAADPG